MRFAMILWERAHWIYESDERPDWPPDPDGNPVLCIDISDKPEVQEGWGYDHKTEEFFEPFPTL